MLKATHKEVAGLGLDLGLLGCGARDSGLPSPGGALPATLWDSPMLCLLIANPGGALLGQEPPGIGSALWQGACWGTAGTMVSYPLELSHGHSERPHHSQGLRDYAETGPGASCSDLPGAGGPVRRCGWDSSFLHSPGLCVHALPASLLLPAEAGHAHSIPPWGFCLCRSLCQVPSSPTAAWLVPA